MGHHEAEGRFLNGLVASGHQVQPLELAGEPDAAALALLPPGTRSRHTVVLSHGGGNDRLYGVWYLVERLLAQGHAVVTAHLPGHGLHGRDHFTLEACRRRLDAMVAAAYHVATGAPLVIGQSMGGALALDLALRRSPIHGAALISAPVALRLDARLMWEFPALLGPAFLKAYRYAGLWGALPAAGPFKRREFPVRVPHGSYIKAFADLLEALQLVDRCNSTGVAVPIRIVHGRWDGIIPLANARRLSDALGKAATLQVIGNAWHLDPLLHRRSVDGLLAWLAGIAAPSEG